MSRIQRIAVAIVTACLCASAGAAGVKPIKSEGEAARAVLSTTFLQYEAQQYDFLFAFSSRNLVDRALRQLNAVTSYAALANSPGGVTVSCPVSGSLTARVINPWLRTVRLDWNECLRDQNGFLHLLDGPAEVTLIAETLTPSVVPSIRFGNSQRDHVEKSYPGPGIPPGFGSDTTYRNLRLTGVLPLARLDEFSNFQGRYTFEVTGFYRFIQHLPDYVSGGDGLYDHDHTVSTEGALLSGEFTNVGYDYNTDFRLLLGKISETYVVPATPSNPTSTTLGKFVRGTDLRIQNGFDNDLLEFQQSIDGKVEADFNQWWGFGCAAPETWVYRTRQTLTYPNDAWTNTFNAGEVDINGTTRATFSSTGTVPQVDLVGHVAVEVGGVGSFNYDYPGFSLFSSPELYTAAICPN